MYMYSNILSRLTTPDPKYAMFYGIYKLIDNENIYPDYVIQEIKKIPFEDNCLVQADNDGWTLMHMAAIKGNVAAMEALVSRGASVDGGITNLHKDPITPLGYAVKYYRYDTAKWLLEKGADITLGSSYYHTKPLEVLKYKNFAGDTKGRRSQCSIERFGRLLETASIEAKRKAEKAEEEVKKNIENGKDLIQKGNFEAVKLLISKSKKEVGSALIEELEKSKNPKVVEVVISIMQNPNNSNLRKAAIQTLGKLGDFNAVAPISATLQSDSDKIIRDIAIVALKDLGQNDKEIHQMSLIGALKDGDEEIRCSACRELAELRDPRAVSPTIDMLNLNYKEEGITTAIKALGKLGDAVAVEPISAVLQNNFNKDIRDIAFAALKDLGQDKEKIYHMSLIGALKDNDKEIRYSACKGLVELNDLNHVIITLESELKYDHVFSSDSKRALIMSLGDLRGKKVLKAIKDQLKNSLVREDRDVAVIALKKMGQDEQQIHYMSLMSSLKHLEHNSTDVQVAIDACKQIGELGGETCEKLEELCDYSVHDTAHYIYEAFKKCLTSECEEPIKALGKLGYSEGVDYIKSFSYINFEEVRVIAVDALTNIGKLGGRKALKDIMRIAEKNHEITPIAIEALGNIGNREALSTLKRRAGTLLCCFWCGGLKYRRAYSETCGRNMYEASKQRAREAIKKISEHPVTLTSRP